MKPTGLETSAKLKIKEIENSAKESLKMISRQFEGEYAPGLNSIHIGDQIRNLYDAYLMNMVLKAVERGDIVNS